MTPEEFHEMLPDYLAGELSESQELRLRAFLEAHPAERFRVEELRAAQQAVRQTAPSPTEAEDRVVGLPSLASLAGPREAGLPATRTAAGRFRFVPAALRYAAVVLLAFAGGYITRGWRPAEPAETPAQPEIARVAPAPAAGVLLPDALSPHLAERLERAIRAYPQGQTLTWALLSLAAR